MFWVYVIKCSDGTIYIGQTNDLERRLHEHHVGQVRRTKSRRPLTLLKAWKFDTREKAVEYEKKFKTGFGRQWIKKNLL